MELSIKRLFTALGDDILKREGTLSIQKLAFVPDKVKHMCFQMALGKPASCRYKSPRRTDGPSIAARRYEELP